MSKREEKYYENLGGTNVFDSRYKNSIRNYYIYGFRSFSDTNKKTGHSTEYKNWHIIKDILRNEWKFYSHSKDVHYISYDESWTSTNPLDKLYAFHIDSLFPTFFFIILELSHDAHYQYAYDQDNLEKALEDGKNIYDYDHGTFIVNKLSLNLLLEYALNEETHQKVRSTELLSRIYENFNSLEKRTFTSRVTNLEDLGIIHSYNEEQRNQWLDDLHVDRNKTKMKYNRFKCWVLSDTLNDYIKDINKENLSKMIQFFSQYEVLGSIGSHLLERMDCRVTNHIHYKNQYLMETIYDYNLMSLLIAIENHDYCFIEYNHGTQNQSSQHFIYPIEIRISVKNGREHLIYYDPITKVLSSLRIDFIDNIELYDSSKPIEIIETIKNEKKHYIFDTLPDIDKHILDYIWGVDTNMIMMDNYKQKMTTVTIRYKDDEFIGQLLKEIRHGHHHAATQTMTFDVFSSLEMMPWIRSLYPHLLDYQQTTHSFIYEDIDELNHSYLSHSAKQTLFKDNKIKIVGKITPISKFLHNGALFNELFSYKNRILADSYLQYAHDDTKDLMSIIKENIRGKYNQYVSLDYADNDYGQNKLAKDIMDDIEDELLLVSNHKAMYSCDKASYFDILPMTTIELRWLKTIINQSYALLFIDQKDIDLLNQRLSNIQPFHLDMINYYDREKHANCINPTFIHCFQQLNRVFDHNNVHKIKITLASHKELLCYSGWIEYSKLKDNFVLVGYDDIHLKRYVIEIDKIQSIDILEETMPLEDIEQILKEDYSCAITIYFNEVRNVPDRILNEFAPWNKECIYNKDKNPSYQLTIYYDPTDEDDIIRRILSYGPYVQINEDNHIHKEILERIYQQKDILHINDKEKI